MSLSSCQSKAVTEFQQLLSSKQNKEMLITGPAGTGKTYLVQYLLDFLESRNTVESTLKTGKKWNFFVTATTNKAAAVLRDFLNPPPPSGKAPVRAVVTIHALLGLKVKDDIKTGKTHLVQDKRLPHLCDEENTVIFIDEASMISKELVAWLDRLKNVIKVYIGDPYQLPPVGEVTSPIFKKNIPKIHLTSVLRYGSNMSILDTAEYFKTMVDNQTGWPDYQVDGVQVISLNQKDFRAKLDRDFTDPALVAGHCNKVVAWTNRRVVQYNNHIRQLLGLPMEPQAKDVMITNKPIFQPPPVSRRGYVPHSIDTPLLQAEREVQIYALSTKDLELVGAAKTYEIPGYEVSLYGRMQFFMPSDWDQVNRIKRELARAKDWSNFFYIERNFLDLRPWYAQTCHKAQGSTYKNVFIDVHDIRKNRKRHEVARLMYVAITRASERVYLYDQ